MRPEALTAAMERAVAEGVFPGGVLWISYRDRPVYHRAFGRTVSGPEGEEVTPETWYDLASLTKPLLTAALTVIFLDRGWLRLDDPLSKWFSGWNTQPRREVTVSHLLSHSSGLPAWRPIYREFLDRRQAVPTQHFETPLRSGQAKAELYARVAGEPLIYSPGSRAEYSDLGFILLGALLENTGGKPLDLLARGLLFEPMGLHTLAFNPLSLSIPPSRIAPTEVCPWRGRLLHGEVHDDHAGLMGGVAGHAGLFGTAEGTYRLSAAWMNADLGTTGILSSTWVRRFWAPSGVPGSSFVLGWDTPSSGSIPSAAGQRFSPGSVGHLGFTGTSIWIDRRREMIVILLSNRVYPSRSNERIKGFRPLLHDLIIKEWEG